MENYTLLENKLLLAMPTLADPNFFQAVVYLCEYSKQGAMGIIINKPLDISLGEVLRHLAIPIEDNHVDDYQVLKGGPIAQEQGFIIHRTTHLSHEDEYQPDGEISISASKQDLALLAQGKGLGDALVSLGYAGWSAGQLEQELRDNAWLVVPADPTIIFDTPYEMRWRKSAGLIGVDFAKMSGEVGHA